MRGDGREPRVQRATSECQALCEPAEDRRLQYDGDDAQRPSTSPIRRSGSERLVEGDRDARVHGERLPRRLFHPRDAERLKLARRAPKRQSRRLLVRVGPKLDLTTVSLAKRPHELEPSVLFPEVSHLDLEAADAALESSTGVAERSVDVVREPE